MLDRIIRLSGELPILFSNNLLRRRQYGRALFVFAGKPALEHRRNNAALGKDCQA